ncbi:hypothetical protein Ciccas_006957 [Cichlidogyrus casuarinus]|uniref:Uncharacterized protein n=1 Tax=Cichlidogyrus casuarinus TaxID=1844966 RepID=A0ABD2Q6S9_9PLAT
MQYINPANESAPAPSHFISENFNFDDAEYIDEEAMPAKKLSVVSPNGSTLPLLLNNNKASPNGSAELDFLKPDHSTTVSSKSPTHSINSPSKMSSKIKNQLAKVGDKWYLYKYRKSRGPSQNTRKPSVAFADYDISDKRSSAMSSVLLLFAMLEGICGFVLPISDAFSKASHKDSKKGDVEHKYYYEAFLLIQYTCSILSLMYLQGLIFYYDQKHNKQSIFMSNQVLMNRCNHEQSDADADSEEFDRLHADEYNKDCASSTSTANASSPVDKEEDYICERKSSFSSLQQFM